LKSLGVDGSINYNYEVVDFSSCFKICPHTYISHLFRLEILALANLYPNFAHTTLQFLGYGGDTNLDWQMFLILVRISTITMLITTVAHNLVSTDLLYIGYGTIRCLQYG
jgi:hypothetical protein